MNLNEAKAAMIHKVNLIRGELLSDACTLLGEMREDLNWEQQDRINKFLSKVIDVHEKMLKLMNEFTDH